MKTMANALRELDEIEGVFAALAHGARRHILIVLNARGGRVAAGDIASRFGHSWPTTSRHLRVLLDAGLVSVEREGRGWFYVLNGQRLSAIAGGWLNWFEPREKQDAHTGDRLRAV